MTSDAGYWDERTEQVKAAVRAAVTEESVLAYVAQRGVAVNAKQVTEALKPEGINGWTSTRRKRVDAVLAKLSALELDFRSLVEKLSTQTGAVAEVKARVEGMSANHGGRIGSVEQAIVELRTRIVALEDARRRK